ncbi:MAG: hypothetical protein J6Z12_03485 [Paludibacteraceae bacterium]|nr:hypothetical protein [Paludibacteraceae bacterium]
MKRLFIVLLIAYGVSIQVKAQTAVVDPTSVAQRLALFLEEMEEAVEQRFTLIEQAESMREHLQIVQDTKKRLQEVSAFVKSSAYAVDIVNYGTDIGKKIKQYKQEIAGLDELTDEEKYNIVLNMLQLADFAADRVQEGMRLAKSNGSDGEFTDFERLQLLKDIRQNLDDLDRQLDEVLSLSLSANAYKAVAHGLKNLTVKTMMFDFN